MVLGITGDAFVCLGGCGLIPPLLVDQGGACLACGSGTESPEAGGIASRYATMTDAFLSERESRALLTQLAFRAASRGLASGVAPEGLPGDADALARAMEKMRAARAVSDAFGIVSP